MNGEGWTGRREGNERTGREEGQKKIQIKGAL